MRELQNFYRSNWESNGEKIKEIFKTQGKKHIRTIEKKWYTNK